MTRTIALVGGAMALAGTMACTTQGGNAVAPATTTSHSAHASLGANVNKDLAAVRAATAPYHNLDKAIAAGFVPISPCVASPAGGMGFHYGNEALINDPAISLTEPEVLVYAPNDVGKLQLVAVEWIVPAPIWPGGFQNPPRLFGLPFHAGPPPLIVLHAWIWKHNPAGIFEDWNPTVTCPS